MKFHHPHSKPHRRQFLQTAATLVAGGCHLSSGLAQGPRQVKVAAIITEMTYRSHAHVILENFLEPYYFNGQVTHSDCKVVSMYCDQFPDKRDMARQVAKDYGIKLCPTIHEALTMGSNTLAVDAVLCIGEHGNYPLNPKGQREYPRKRFFDETVKVFRQTGKVAPVFNDKHLSYRWDWAKEMYDTAQELKIPFMAGSSVPLAQRIPPMDLPAGTELREAVATHGGGLDSYDFHGLEVLQSMVENRAGGETGVTSVKYMAKDVLWQTAERGVWSPDLLIAALNAEPDRTEGNIDIEKLKTVVDWGLYIQYRDGLKAMVARTRQNGTRWHFACRKADDPKPLATSFYVGPWNNRCLFKALSHAIQAFFRQGKAPYPVERTLLTTGMVAAGVESHHAGDTTYPTEHLNIRYQPIDFRAFREMGASWKLVNEQTVEPKGMDRLGKEAR
ncbi:MAG: hypothetical protein JNJ77_01290 [Planctomycetia bacterium]|nr:hypothetical protein [Planctomycetia bacterium]